MTTKTCKYKRKRLVSEHYIDFNYVVGCKSYIFNHEFMAENQPLFCMYCGLEIEVVEKSVATMD